MLYSFYALSGRIGKVVASHAQYAFYALSGRIGKVVASHAAVAR